MNRLKKVMTSSILLMMVFAMTVVVSPASAAYPNGTLVKSPSDTAVYYINDGNIHPFPRDLFLYTWYGDNDNSSTYWADLNIKTITQAELDSYNYGSNVPVRPGTKLLNVFGSSKYYAVEPGAVLRLISDAEATALYGTNWKNMVLTTYSSVINSYTMGTPLAAGEYPAGTVLNTKGTTDLYYFDGTDYRKFGGADSNATFLANYPNFDNIVVVDDAITASGTEITGAEASLTTVVGAAFASGSTSDTGSGSGSTIGGSGLTVALAADTAPASTLVQGQAIANLATFNFTASSDGDVKITSLKMKRTGVSADTTLAAVYLYDGINRLTDSASVSSTYATWNDSEGIITIPAGTTKSITVKSNIDGSSSGQTVGMSIEEAAHVGTDGATVSGAFPVTGNTMGIATATLAGVQFATSTAPASDGTPNPQSDFELWRNTVKIVTRAVDLSYITFRQIGSINTDDVKDYELFVKGVKVGDTIPKADADGYITFDITNDPLRIETGNAEFKLLADIVGGSTRTVTLSVRQASDVMVIDSQYGANILVTGNDSSITGSFSARSANEQTIGTGTLTITKLSESLSGNVVNNGSLVTLATFELKASGEKIKVETLDVAIAEDDADTDYSLRNGALFADGVQVGSTASIASDNDSPAYTRYTLGSSLVVSPGTPVILTVVADIYDDAGATNGVALGDTIRVDIKQGSANAQRLTSLGYFNVPGSDVTGNVLTVADGSLTLAKAQSYGNQTVVIPATAVKMAEFNLATGSSDGVSLTTLTANFVGTDAFDPSSDMSDVYIVYGADTTPIKATIVDGDNAWTINKTIGANENMNIAVYATLAAGSADGGTADKMTTSLLVAGNTVTSATAVNTNSNVVLGGQVITASQGGTLTVDLANDTPAASMAVAGTQPFDGSIKLKLTAANEEVKIKDIKFRVDVSADDAAISTVDLYAGNSTANMAKVSITKTWDIDGSNPGFVSWTLTGDDRITVPKDGTIYIIAKPTYVSSAQGDVSGTTPALFLADLEAEGATAITPGGTGANAINSTGLIIRSANSATYVDSTETDTAADTDNSTTTIVTANGVVFLPGDIIFIDEDDDNTWDVATEELMVVLADGGANLTVERGAFGTTAVAYTANTMSIFRLYTATMTTSAGVRGAATTVLDTMPTIALASDSPSGSTTGGTSKVIYKFTVTATENLLDPAQNKVSLTTIDLTTTKAGTTVKNLKIYPEVFDQNATYAVTGSALSSTKWRLDMSSMAGSLYEVVEGQTITYVVRADVGSGTNASNSVEVSIASLLSGGDVTWTDGTTSSNWVDQSGASYVSGSALTYGASSGTIDTTDPTITAVVFGGTADNAFTASDTMVITFSEMIDPTTIKSTLVPGGSAVAITDGETGDASLAGTTGVLTLTNILTTDVDAGSSTAITTTTTAALNAAGTELTITFVTVSGGGLAGAETFTDITGLTTTITDLGGEFLADSTVTPTGNL